MPQRFLRMAVFPHRARKLDRTIKTGSDNEDEEAAKQAKQVERLISWRSRRSSMAACRRPTTTSTRRCSAARCRMCSSPTSGTPTRGATSPPTVSLVVVLSLAGTSWRSIPIPSSTAATNRFARPWCTSNATLCQHEKGRPSGSYHNKEWAAIMKGVGLQPSSTGAVGGKETGHRVSHYIIPGGPFAKAFAELAATGWRLNLQSAHRSGKSGGTTNSKTKFTCTCGQNAWGKPDLEIRCDLCDSKMKAAA